jgi:hypothetical protein
MAGLLEQMRAAERARNQGLLSHTPQQQVTGRQVADAMQAVGLLASPIPVVGDVAGLLGDAAMYAAKPEERTLGNAAVTLLGALPFVPSAAAKALGKVDDGKRWLKYGTQHRPMDVAGGAAQLHDLARVFGDEVYDTKKAVQFFGSGDPREVSVLRTMASVRNNPDAMVTIYRGVPDGVSEINAGDWVTLDPRYAKDYGRVISKKVRAADVTSWPDSLAEFGYWPK